MKHGRRDRKRWEQVVELLAAIMLFVPTTLILLSSELLSRGDVMAGSLLLATFTVPPGLALWLIERRRSHRAGTVAAGRDGVAPCAPESGASAGRMMS